MNATILHPDHLILMDQINTVLLDGAVLIGSDGRIQTVGETPAILATNAGVEVERLTSR